MIPLADENPPGKRPYVLYVLVILNILAYIYDVLGAQGPFGRLWDFSMIPYSVVHNAPLMQKLPVVYHGMPAAIERLHHGLNPQWLTIFTSMFMHGSLAHIGFNMLYLWIFGNNIEDALGHIKFLLFYLACGVLAALAHIYSDPNSTIPTVGASGAIAGVLGGYLILYPKNRVRTLIMLGFFWDFVEIPAVFVLGSWFVIQIVSGLFGAAGMQGGGVAYWAHVGGFVAGMVLIILFGGRRYANRRQSRLGPYDDRPYPWRR